MYSIAPFVRTADEVVDELLRRERSKDRPQPQHKRVWAEMTRVEDGDDCTGRERLFVETAIELTHRSGCGTRRTVSTASRVPKPRHLLRTGCECCSPEKSAM